jgi:hypothetical protein
MASNKKFSLIALGVAIAALFASPAMAQDTLGDLIDRVSSQTNVIQLAAFLAYMAGFLFAAMGIYKLRQHVEFGPQKVELPEPLKYLFVAALFLTLPTVASVAQMTFGDTGASQNVGGYSFDDTATAGGLTLDGMMIAVMQNAYDPMMNLLVFFAYAAGAALMVIAIHRFTKTEREGARGPTGIGTIATFLLAGGLFSLAPMTGMLVETLFGTRGSMLQVNFMALDGDATGVANARNVVTAVLMFLVVVGALSILRGFFVLRGVAEGAQQMTMMSGISHIVAGAILVNFGQFLNIIQTTLGVDTYGVSFSV